MMTYDFAKEFSPVPGPRHKEIGPYSGELFRDEVLQEWFDSGTQVEININDVQMSFGPSFLSEAFGKMAKKLGSEDEFFKIIHVKQDTAKNKHFEELLHKYVQIALSK